MLKKSWNPFMGLHNYCCPRAFKLLHEGKEYGLYLKNENLTNLVFTSILLNVKMDKFLEWQDDVPTLYSEF